MSYNRLGIGLGTGNPSSILHIKDSLNSTFLVENGGGTGANSEIKLSETGDSGVKLVYSSDANQLRMITRTAGVDNTTPSLIVDRATGRVGIGSTQPQQALDISGSINLSGGIFLGGVSAPIVSQWLNSGSNIYYNLGNVGIGTGSPQDSLQINGNIRMYDGVGNTYLRIERGPGNGDHPRFQVYDNNGNAGRSLLLQPIGGNVGIGTTNPQSRLHLDSGTNFNTLELRSTGSSDGPFTLFKNNLNTAFVGFLNTDHSTTLRQNAFEILNNSANGKIHFSAGGGNAGSPSMVIVPGGNVGIGTISPIVPLHTEGKIFINDTTGITGGQGTTMVIRNQQTNTSIFQIQGPGISTVADFSSNGNVGIGTNNPGYKLEVAGNIMAKSDTFVRINVHDTSQGGSGWGIDQGGFGGPVNSFGIVQNGVAPRMVFLPNGNVGIGTPTPQAILHVMTSTFNFDGISNSYMTASSGFGGGFLGNLSGNQLLSIRASGAIWSETVVVASSDSRIKKNITQIDDTGALAKLRLVEPAEYDYIDQIARGQGRVFGFIAQQVREHFPEAVTLQKSVVPDVYSLHTVDVIGHKLTLVGKARAGKLQLITTKRELKVDVTSPEPDVVQLPEGTLTEEELQDGKVFVYGYEVEDFHTLNKDFLFTINFAATQELDRKMQTLETENASLKTEVSGLRSELQALRDVLRDKGLIE